MNSALHGEPEPDKIMKDFADIAILSVHLLSLNPDRSRDPYYGYNKNLESFLLDVLGSKEDERMLPDWFSAALQPSRKCGR